MSPFSHKIFSLCTITILLFVLSFSSGYKILGVLPTTSRSHFIVGSALMKGLARKGHEVTVISPFPLKRPMENYHDVTLFGLQKSVDKTVAEFLLKLDRSIVENIVHFHEMGIKMSRVILEEPTVQELMQSNQTFDVVICLASLSEALFGLSEHFNAPLISLSPFGAHTWNTDMIGSPSPPSYVPSPFLPFTDRMSLLERLGNLAFITFERLLLDFYYLPKQAALYKEFFPQNNRSMYEVRRNAALVLVNQHVSLTSPRPYMPNHIEVGGMQINRQRKPLPPDMQRFIDESEHGVIYFSLGSNFKSKNLPSEKRKAILTTFRGLKQRVFWKFEDPTLISKPHNVFISEWFPQDDILAHPNVRAFITHGGLLSTTEAIYHGKPFIGIPMIGDQFLNMARAESHGYGILLDYQELTTDNFRTAIKRITEDPTYSKRVQDMSAQYRDQPMEPLERAIFWVEHVVRNKGAAYMHCAGQDLNFIQYHSISTMLILSGVVLLVTWFIFMLLRFDLLLLRSFFIKKEEKKIVITS